MKPRNCLECRKPIVGRADKRFCDTHCRSSYHNRVNSEQNTYIRTIDGVLKRNRRILKHLLDFDKDRNWEMDAPELIGINLNYYTQITQVRSDVCYWSYDYGFVLLPNNTLQIEQRAEK